MTPTRLDYHVREMRNIAAFLAGAAIVALVLFACAGAVS